MHLPTSPARSGRGTDRLLAVTHYRQRKALHCSIFVTATTIDCRYCYEIGRTASFRGGAIVKSLKILIVALSVIGMTWITATPAQAQLTTGCKCPAGFIPSGATTCTFNFVFVPAICTARNAINESIGHVASSQQQQSFWGVQMMLQQRRDQLQGTSGSHGTSSSISGYSSSDFDTDTNALGYDSQSQKTNPLASGIYDAAPAATPANPALGAWAQGLGDWERDAALSATDITHFTSTYTAQAGLDGMWRGLMSSEDALVVGIVSSWTNTHTDYDGSSTTMNLVGPGIGIYSTYVKGGFSTDLTAKFDLLRMSEDLAGTAPNTSVGILNAGLSGNVQYKVMGDGNNFLEPTVGFTLSHTSFGSGGAALNLEDAYTVRLQAGARVGTTWDAGNGVSIDLSLKALVYGNAVAQGTSTVAASFLPSAISPSDEGLVRAELDPQLCFNLPDGYSVTLSGQLLYGQALLGGSAGVNLRKQW